MSAHSSAGTRASALAGWLERRAGAWREIAARIDRLERGRATPEDALAAAQDYRTVARDLAAARVRLPGARSTRALEAVYSRLHGQLDRSWRDPRDVFVHWFQHALPASFARVRTHVLWVSLLFCLAIGAGFWLVGHYPELGGLFLGEDALDRVESGELWTDGILNVTPSSVMSVQILANNIAVTLFAFGLGLLFGLGTFYIIANNGLLVGAVFAYTNLHGMAGELGRFVIAHGLVELSVICLCGGAGAYVGEALIRPGGRTRGAALREATADVLPLLVACVLWLVGCGFIEGYVSPDPSYPMWSRLLLGVAWWLVMAGMLAGSGRREPARD